MNTTTSTAELLRWKSELLKKVTLSNSDRKTIAAIDKLIYHRQHLADMRLKDIEWRIDETDGDILALRNIE